MLVNSFVIPSIIIDSLGVMAYSINPRVICKEVAWLVKGSEPAYMEVLRVLEG